MSTSPFRLKRGEDGNLLPIEGKTPNFGHEIKVLPITYGEARGLDSFGELLSDWTPEDRYHILKNHIVEPVLDIESVEDLENNFDPFTVEDLFQAVFMYSGVYKLFEDGNDQGNE